MHIGTGIHEGKQIKDSCTLSSRFLTIKEEIFTIVGTRVIDATVLDINDNNGMYGIEALSRGAKCAKFVNPDKKEANLTCENLDSLGLNSDQMVVCDEAEEYLKNPQSDCAGETYDVCFFNVKKKEEFDLVDNILVRQNADGITVVYYPDLDDFDLPQIAKEYKVVETRDCEDKKVAIIISAE